MRREKLNDKYGAKEMGLDITTAGMCAAGDQRKEKRKSKLNE
jgi:hypothetical protein